MKHDFQPGDTVTTPNGEGVVRAVTHAWVTVDLAAPGDRNAWGGESQTYDPATLTLVAHGPRDRSFWNGPWGMLTLRKGG